ncbi:MAG: trimethylamine methyltransferase family protein [Gammaproteobacteria bacterium]|nr:trimethylamine methyltransferase family protein [Gammaproteobacteria bacterium]MYD77302.1 trimethylamine methyltransferase family protein [Gammaproteobacteria bacterium]MYJ51870.1 trimethylamine methyltransferase family protein [Gammaproteobacteria bacterium]
MTETVGRRGRRARNKATHELSTGIRQLPRKQLANPFPPIAPLSEEQIEHIHESSMQVLEEQGVEVLGDMALDVFRKAGANVDSGGIVRMDRGLVMEAISTAPSEITVMSRNPARPIHAGGNSINFGLVSGPPNVHDCIRGRRPGNLDDYKKVISLGQFFNVIHFIGTQGVATTDLPPNTRHLDTTLINITLCDKPYFAIGIGGGRIRDAAHMTGIAQGISMDELKSRPSLLTNININSPRKFDDSMAYAGMQMAMLGQPVVVTPFTLMGAMTPATMAGALVQQNAEALLGLSLLQLTAPGAPVVYGAFTTNVDMRSGSPAFGTPENAFANMASGQLARRYRLPYRSSACNASNANDCQATWETEMALWGSVMGYANFIYHSAGWLEGGLLTSFEKIVTDCEMLQHMSRLLEAVPINDMEIGLEAMDQVGPGGHFFGSPHTLERYKDAFYEPFLSDWQNSESWQGSGSKDATMRATEIWQQILQEFEPPPLDPAILEELEAFVRQRKAQIGREEPALEPIGY